MDPTLWHQAHLRFNDPDQAETTAATHLGPALADAEDSGLLSAWFFTRKTPIWRIRYRTADDTAATAIRQRLDAMAEHGHISAWTAPIYEPESHAFGGTGAMDTAHRLFHADSRNILTYLARSTEDPHTPPGKQRELSILLGAILLRAAGQDWYEQGDVWARVAEHRKPDTDTPAGAMAAMEPAMRQLLTVDATPLLAAGTLAFAAAWAQAFATAGTELAHLAAQGHLSRGLRDVLAHHLLFAWNRLGLPHTTQVVQANTARTVVFGPDPRPEASA
jgi:thiopeptide-type bacteriocin biosynthesis protein